ncbi:MAG TPA: ribonuclease P protein component [Saprospiraceae bacterium]|nr:ribonuclease P protein component [Saprospiraceae bacterium]
MPDNQFKKNEKLKSRKRIATLFEGGQSFAKYPLRVVWAAVGQREGEAAVQFGVSVAKKKFPKAVHRNRIRRLVREAWRLHKYRLVEAAPGKQQALAVMMLYTGTQELPFTEIEAAMKELIHRLLKKWH